MNRDFKSEFGLVQADTLIKTGQTFLGRVTIAWQGWTVGEFCTFKDSLTAAGGTTEVMIVFPTANGTMQLQFPEGKEFSTGLFFNKGSTATGSVWVEGNYR